MPSCIKAAGLSRNNEGHDYTYTIPHLAVSCLCVKRLPESSMYPTNNIFEDIKS